MKDGFVVTILAIGVAFAIGQLIANRLFRPAPVEEVKTSITTGDKVKDFLINF